MPINKEVFITKQKSSHTHFCVERFQHPHRIEERAEIEYIVHEKNPKKPWVFFACLVHGDEYEALSSLMQSIKNNIDSLPNFVFVPIASPSAYENQSHKNKFGNNVNRKVNNEKYSDPEAQVLKKIIRKHMQKTGQPFQAGFMFHQDRDRHDNRWYYYHYGDAIDLQIEQLRKESTEMGMSPYSGDDDQKDRFLGYYAKNGVIDAHIKNDCSLEEYLTKMGTSTSFVFESPINLLPEKKDALTELFFQNIVLPVINN